MRGVRGEKAAEAALTNEYVAVMQFSYRLYGSGGDRMLAICDAEIAGRSFEEKELRIEVSEFYSGSACDEKSAVRLMKSATIVNAVGRNIVSIMIKNSLVDEGMVLYIQGVPHAQSVSAP